LFNLKTEPVEDRERRYQETNRAFLRRCRDPNEICAYDEPVEDLQPEETNTEIKSEPIDEIEEDTSSLYMETESLDYPPEFYSESTDNSSQIIAFNPAENELENNMTQQSIEPEEETDQQNHIPITEPLVLITSPSSIDTTTNAGASDLDNTNTNSEYQYYFFTINSCNSDH